MIAKNPLRIHMPCEGIWVLGHIDIQNKEVTNELVP